MINILLTGVSGAMGSMLQQIIAATSDCEVVAGFDHLENTSLPFHVYTNLENCQEKVDVIIDFSHFKAFPAIFAYAKAHKIPIVVATTGLSEEDLQAIDQGAKEFPIFKTANMSIGINLLAKALEDIAGKLEDGFDIEIIEKHHNQKIDAPSGTALAIADEINTALTQKYDYIYDRTKVREKRKEKEIGIHSVRGGTIVGEHSIIFAGNDEVIELTHIANSKEVFAIGALKAATFMDGKAPGMYSMSDLINEF